MPLISLIWVRRFNAIKAKEVKYRRDMLRALAKLELSDYWYFTVWSED